MNRKQRRADKAHGRPGPQQAPVAVQSVVDYALRHHQAGRLSEAERLYREVLQLEPRHPDALHLLGVLNMQLGRLDVSVDLITKAIAQNANVPAFHSNLGNALTAHGELEKAVTAFRRALALMPNLVEAHGNLGNALRDQGKLDEAVAAYRQALALRPDYADAEMNLAFTQLHRPSVGLADILAASRRWNDAHAARFQERWPVHARPAQPDRLPRIGFVSADFRAHAVGFLVIPAIEGLARAGFHLTCYSNSVATDALTARFVKAASVWRPAAALSDDALAEQIRADGIDILIDLSGLSAGHRLLAFARKPAPIQVASWVGFPSTSGLAAMDYFLADRHQVPVGAEALYSEAVVRLPDSYIAFEPPIDAPPVGDPPALSQPGVTFGSFNNLKKITPEVVAAWSTILQRLPTSRLLLKTQALNCTATRRHYAALFAGNGIADDRLSFVGATPTAQHMGWMLRADIALDSFPYAGGRTTLEALWMGLPVITLPRETFASRHSLSYLSSIGLSELAAADVERYVELAVDLANDVGRLAAMRSGLRARILASPLCDVDRFTGNLAAALTTMWRRWCDGQPVAPFDVAGAS
jgi:protein O-GlcNAc transferase